MNKVSPCLNVESQGEVSPWSRVLLEKLIVITSIGTNISQVSVFWDVTPCSVCFRISTFCCLHLQAARSSETSISYHISTRRHNQEGHDLTPHRHDNLKSQIFLSINETKTCEWRDCWSPVDIPSGSAGTGNFLTSWSTVSFARRTLLLIVG
jgi:hypothetical protein